MDLQEHLRLRNRVVSVIRGYQDLKEIYSQFVGSEHVLTLFFDDGGNIRPNPMTLQYSQSLLGKNGADFVLLLALHSYINLSRLL